jgi:hypothetical protein
MSNDEGRKRRIPKLHQLISKKYFAVPSMGENYLKSSARYKRKKN